MSCPIERITHLSEWRKKSELKISSSATFAGFPDLILIPHAQTAQRDWTRTSNDTGRTAGRDARARHCHYRQGIGRRRRAPRPGPSSIAGMNCSPPVGICCGRRHFALLFGAIPLFGGICQGQRVVWGGGVPSPRVRSARRCPEGVLVVRKRPGGKG